jgi:predicted enzyme related to lactoylglutathione lyase
MNLGTVRVFVRDISSAKQFYGERLGLPVHADGSENGYCVFRVGTVFLVAEAVGGDAPKEEQALVGRFTGVSFDVPDMQAKYDELSSRGVEFTGLPERQAWGGILATLRDPAGNELQICQQPGG